MRRRLLALSLFLLLTSNAAFAISKKHSIFILNQESKVCTWEILAVKTGESARVNETSRCPSHILFQRDFKKAWYIEGKELVETELSAEGATRSLAKFSLDPSMIVDFFRDGSTGEIRILGLAVDLKTKNTPQGKRLLFEGREYKPLVLKWGFDAVAFVMGYHHHKWELVAAAATRTGADDTPGTKVVAHHVKRSPENISLTELLAGATCLAQKCVERFPSSWNGQGVAARLGASYSDSAKVGYFPFDGTDEEGIVAQALIDRTTQLFGPPMRCTRRCQEVHPVRIQKGLKSKIAVDIREDSALISNEGLGTGAVLIFQDRYKTERVFPENAVVTWTTTKP